MTSLQSNLRSADKSVISDHSMNTLLRTLLCLGSLVIMGGCLRSAEPVSQDQSVSQSGRPSHPIVPSGLGSKDCTSLAPPGELPMQRFERKGGCSIPAQVRTLKGILTVDAIEQGRMVAQYDRLDLIDPNPVIVSERRVDRMLAQARAFLWTHWTAHHRGYMTLTMSSVDATSTSHIFVEPDDGGRWRVAWRIVRHFGSVDDLPTYYGVEWDFPA